MEIKRAIISGGGTGGHIFPALAIADEIKRRNPAVEILFVGAEGKMEMEKVPQAGYAIIGLPIVGLQRKFDLKNFLLPFKLVKSLWKAYRVIADFKPDIVVGVGGYASGPLLQVATKLNYPCLIQEQNSFAGKTNKILGASVDRICTAYDGMETYFPKNKIVLTGNPVRKDLADVQGKREEAIRFFNLDPSYKTILVIGGSLGAKTLNDSLLEGLSSFSGKKVQLLWQCGKFYQEILLPKVAEAKLSNVQVMPFIQRMDLAYSVADVVISRAGALSISELCILGKPAILVPSPNVAEDHQTQNAMNLVRKDAAVLVKDSEARQILLDEVFTLIENEERLEALSKNILTLAKPDATKEIVNQIELILA